MNIRPKLFGRGRELTKQNDFNLTDGIDNFVSETIQYASLTGPGGGERLVTNDRLLWMVPECWRDHKLIVLHRSGGIIM